MGQVIRRLVELVQWCWCLKEIGAKPIFLFKLYFITTTSNDTNRFNFYRIGNIFLTCRHTIG